MKNCQPMKVHLQVIVETHRFSTGEIIGGDAALDFINTVTGRDQSPRDWLDSYARLLVNADSLERLRRGDSAEEIMRSWEAALESFRDTRARALIYK